MKTQILEHKDEQDDGQVPVNAVMFRYVVKQALYHVEITDLPSSSEGSVYSTENVMEEGNEKYYHFVSKICGYGFASYSSAVP